MSEDRDVETIARLMDLVARYGLEELEVAEGGLHVTLYAEAPYSSDEEPAEAGSRSYLWHPPAWPEQASPKRSETAHAITAPLTGTFYRADSPEAPPLVEAGDTVEEGQKIGLIEAMKVFSDVVADRAGVIVEIVVQNGRVVQRDEILLYIEPAS
ncbi:MAG: acetyl-CoA carboxylase, biotin carboxyl carrier protein [Armatimonadetes bacterium]|nr:acetyl-CoA carboxylase, biotin carboxyl carrier protein [Armatimonadota bacterium]